MPLLATEIDLFNANGHWTVAAFEHGQTLSTSAADALTARFGTDLVAAPETVRNFVTLVQRSMAAARDLSEGLPLPVGNVPVIPIANRSGRFLTQGIVKVIAPDLEDTEEPLQTTIPWGEETQAVPQMDKVIIGIDIAILEELAKQYPDDPNIQKRLQKARYIRGRGTPAEYDITPFFVWRTS